MRLFFLVTIIFNISCSTGQKSIAPRDEFVEKKMEEIENSDFDKVQQVKFILDNDNYDGELKNLNSISEESLHKVSSAELEDLSSLDRPLGTIMSYCYKKSFEQAFKSIDLVYKKYQKHPGFWNIVGNCYFLKSDIRKALLFYNKALGLNSKYAPSINNIGVISILQKKYDNALNSFKKARRIASNSKTPSFNLAQIYLRYGLVSKAKNLFYKLYKVRPGDVDILNGLATSLLFSKQANKAVSIFEKISSEHFVNPSIGINFSLALNIVGRKNDAVEVFREINISNSTKHKGYYKNVEKFIMAGNQ